MRRLTFLALLLCAAAPHRSDLPQSIGRFADWQAATHREGGALVCYAFTRAIASNPRLAGRGDVVLTVTERPGSRDAVAISAGVKLAGHSDALVGVGTARLAFYIAGRSAFARDGHAAVAAFAAAEKATSSAHGPKSLTLTDVFSLRGFNAAYAAVGRACPAPS